MKKEITLCDKCKKAVAGDKCFICELDICEDCLEEFYINFSRNTNSNYYNSNSLARSAELFARAKLQQKPTKNIELTPFNSWNAGACLDCLKDLSRVLGEHNKKAKDSGVTDALKELTTKLREIVIGSKL